MLPRGSTLPPAVALFVLMASTTSPSVRYAHFVTGAGSPAGSDDARGRIVWSGVLVRAGFRHAIAALRHNAVLHQRLDHAGRRRRAGDPEAAHFAEPARAAGAHLSQQIDRMRRHPEKEFGAGFFQSVHQAGIARQIVQHDFAAAGQRGDQGAEAEVMRQRTAACRAQPRPDASRAPSCGRWRATCCRCAARPSVFRSCRR